MWKNKNIIDIWLVINRNYEVVVKFTKSITLLMETSFTINLITSLIP